MARVGERLSRNGDKWREQVNEKIVELGGKPLRKEYGRRQLYGSRGGAAGPVRALYLTPHIPCFGRRLSLKSWTRSHYSMVTHVTLDTCLAKCYKKAIVVCVREFHDGERYMTTHIAGECPFCEYHK